MHTTSSPLRSRRGFTLVELLATLVILGVLVAIAAPRFNTFRLGKSPGAINELAANLSLTRMEAIRSGATARLTINSTGTTYQIVVGNADATTTQTVKTVSVTSSYPGIVLRPVSDSVVFDGRGLRRAGTRAIAVVRDNTRMDSLMITPIGKVSRAR